MATPVKDRGLQPPHALAVVGRDHLVEIEPGPDGDDAALRQTGEEVLGTSAISEASE
jgi:hypothetical protein